MVVVTSTIERIPFDKNGRSTPPGTIDRKRLQQAIPLNPRGMPEMLEPTRLIGRPFGVT